MNSRITRLLRFTKYFVIILIFPVVSFLNSCKEDTGGIGANVLPPSDQISAYEADTTTVLTSMYLKDSVLTSGFFGQAPLDCQIGSYNDPIFGETKASIFAQVFTPVGATYLPWADTGTVDSAVLALPYFNLSAYYGNLNPQTFVVDTLESIIDSLNPAGHPAYYYSDTTIKYGSYPIGLQQITPYPVANGFLRIRLNNSWTQSIANKLKGNVNYYLNFGSLVKGVYITTNNSFQLPGQGGILQVNLSNPVGQGDNSAIYFYYHFPNRAFDTVENTLPFPVGNSTIPTSFFSHYSFNYSTSPFHNEHPEGHRDSINGNDFVYVQSMGGVIGRVNFPNLYKNWSKLGSILINEAELDVTVNAQDAGAPFYPSTNLQLLATDSVWQPYATADMGYPYYNGSYDLSNSTYTFVITQYIQKVIDGKIKDRGMYLIPDQEATSANRTVLYGAQHNQVQTSQRMRLRIFYTPLGATTHAPKKH